MADKKLKGIAVLYVNLFPDLGQQLEPTLIMVKEMNRPLIKKLSMDAKYACLIIPTTKEASRVEKIDYDAPFPRYMPQSADVNKEGLGQNVKAKKKVNIFKGPVQEEEVEEVVEESVMQGFITLFMNFHPDVNLDPAQVLKMVQNVNQEAIQEIIEDGQYQVLIVPTTKEATRIEKVDFEMPFPRLSPKNVSKTKSGIVTPKLPVPEEEDDGPCDEIEDEELEEEGKE